MADKFEESIKSYLIEDPYKIFLSPDLSYKSSEIQYIIRNQLELAAKPLPVNLAAIQVLQSTVQFRRQTVPNNIFAELRQETMPDEAMVQIFESMARALTNFETFGKSGLNKEEKQIYKYVEEYVKKSIRNRIESLSPEDRLLPFWHESKLKQLVG